MKIHVYLFDDDEVIRHMIQMALTEAGYGVTCFTDPSEIYQTLRVCSSPEQADLVITDINMPFISGIMFAEKLIHSGFNRENILVISGSRQGLYEIDIKGFGLQMLSKPFAISGLMNWIEERKCRIRNDCLVLDWSNFEE